MKTEGYITVIGETEAEYTEKRSRFIATLKHCETEEEAAEFINALDNRGVGMLYVSETGEIALDFGSVVTAVHTYIMGDKNFLRYKDNKNMVADIRNRMARNRIKTE